MRALKWPGRRFRDAAYAGPMVPYPIGVKSSIPPTVGDGPVVGGNIGDVPGNRTAKGARTSTTEVDGVVAAAASQCKLEVTHPNESWCYPVVIPFSRAVATRSVTKVLMEDEVGDGNGDADDG